MKTIIEMAREAGWGQAKPHDDCIACGVFDLEAFAELVRADEREAILDLVDSYAKNNTDLADAIRARGQA
jgi:hypothetical protein